MKISKNLSDILEFLLIGILGLLIIFVSSLFQDVVIPKENQSFTRFLNANFTKPVSVAFFIAGFLFGYFLKLNPWKTGIGLFLVFPVAALMGAILYKEDHNLLGIEFFIYFLLALPSIIAAFIGRFIARQMAKRKT